MTKVGKIKIEFYIACSEGHSTGHLKTKIRSLTQFFTKFIIFYDLKHAL